MITTERYINGATETVVITDIQIPLKSVFRLALQIIGSAMAISTAFWMVSLVLTAMLNLVL